MAVGRKVEASSAIIPVIHGIHFCDLSIVGGWFVIQFTTYAKEAERIYIDGGDGGAGNFTYSVHTSVSCSSCDICSEACYVVITIIGICAVLGYYAA
jgi:ferredoxin